MITNLRRQRNLIFLGLTGSVLIVFGPLCFYDFVFFDDHVYVIEKPQITSGLTLSSLRWAFTTTDAGFWHPLTWISLMIDHQFWGLHPGGYHLTNLLLHLSATLLLFSGLKQMTNSLIRSGFAAALFALHPLHVESVAWIAERKDVLSGLFWMLSLLLYARYVAKPQPVRYLLMMASFIMGLMAKPMVVTLPFIMLLLDYWPLNRWSAKTWKGLVVEKIPLVLLGLLAGVITIIAEKQVGALKTWEEFPFIHRLFNAVIAYCFYIFKMVWPSGLSVHYPHPGAWPLIHVTLALGTLSLITFWAFRRARTEPFFLVGWAWFLISLLPVIGLIQIGSHAFADRYTYLPLIGLFITLVWGAGGLFEHKQWPWPAAIVIGMAVLAVLAFLSRQQGHYWQNAETLFRQAVKVTRNNYLAYNNLGAALSRQGRHREALAYFDQVLHIRPDYLEALFNKGAALAGQGHYAEALPLYRKVLALNPHFAEAHNNLAIAYAQLGYLDQAIFHFREAVTIKPSYQQAVINLRIAEQQLPKQP